MAAQATDSRSRPPHAYTIGYAMLPNKRDTFVQPSFLDMAAQHGIRLVAVDASRPLVEQGPFDLIVHKLYDQAWRAQLEAFSALHPDVPVVDPPAAIDPILDRSTMLDVVSGLSIDASGSQEQGVPSVGIPRQVVVNDAADLDDPAAAAAAAGDLRFPLIAKPVVVDGSAASHDLCLVFRREGLRGLHAPLVIQEFVNHGGVLFKVYVVGDHATCVTRSSLPDVPDERLHDATAPAAVPFANVSLLPPPAAAGDNSATKMPPADFINKVARELRRALGLHLINFDLIRATDGKYFIVDINYCPGYSKMPGFEPVLTEFFLEMLRARPVRDEQRRPVSGQEAEVPIVPKKGIEPIPGPSEAGLGQVQA